MRRSSARQEQALLVAGMRRGGRPWVEVAAELRRRFRLNPRTAFRVAHGWSQREAADEWNRRWPDDPKTLKNFSAWEVWPAASGHAPSMRSLGRLAELYHCSVSDLLADQPDYRHLDQADIAVVSAGGPVWVPVAAIESTASVTAPGGGDYHRVIVDLVEWAHRMNRRDVLRWLSSVATMTAVAPTVVGLDDDERERTLGALVAPSRLDDATVDHIEAVLWRCMRQDDALGPVAALETTLAQRNLIRRILPSAQGRPRTRLLSLYANVLRFAGWLSFDLSEFDAASAYFESARAAAHEAADSALGAFVLCNMSHLATWRGQARVGIDHAVAASAWAAQTDDDHLKAYAFDVAARAYAMDQQERAALTALGTAQQLMAGSAGSTTGLVYFFNEGQLASTEGLCYQSLGQPDRAVATMERAVRSIEPSFVRNLAMSSLRLGVCRLRLDPPDVVHAAHDIQVAAQLASHNHSTRLNEQLRQGVAQLGRWSSVPAVRAVTEQIASYGVVAA